MFINDILEILFFTVILIECNSAIIKFKERTI